MGLTRSLVRHDGPRAERKLIEAIRQDVELARLYREHVGLDPAACGSGAG
jgi:hypothetical protein